MEFRILFHAPDGRDAALVGSIVGASHPVTVCSGAADLARCLGEGSAAAILAEEALADQGIVRVLSDWLAKQPSWSDYPIIVLASARRPDGGSVAPIVSLDRLGNVNLLPHPIDARALASAVDTGVRCRLRQYAMRQQLEQISRNRGGHRLQTVGQLVGEIAHDFNNLLHVVNMNLELISMYAKEEKVKPVVERARTAARRGAKVTGQLLAFARNQPQVPKSTDVNRLLVGMQELLDISVGSGIAVALDLCDGAAAALVDACELETVVLDLTMKLRESIPKGGAVSISTRRRHLSEEQTASTAAEYVVIALSGTREGNPAQIPSQAGSGSQPGIAPASSAALNELHELARQCGGLAFVTGESGQSTRVEICLPAAAPHAGSGDEAPPAGA